MKIGNLVRVQCIPENNTFDGMIGTIVMMNEDTGPEGHAEVTRGNAYGLCIMLSNGNVYGFLPEEIEVITSEEE